MKTAFRAKQPYADIFLRCAQEYVCTSPVKPDRFIRTMRENQGSIAGPMGPGLDEDGLERKNPVIVALGDSVTAGHFESLFPSDPEAMKQFVQRMETLRQAGKPTPVEITDARESYIEKFRLGLIDLFETTSVSVINAGIAGDHLISMAKRADRDVIRYQPDLVLINGSLNWGEDKGTTAEYKQILIDLVRKIKQETQADIILLTPNGDLPLDGPFFQKMGIPVRIPTTPERVAAIREIATEEQVCLADVYAVWEMAREQGCPWKEILSNGFNHPGVEGHEVYATVLMKLFQ
ncbi:MAG: GDSL-type esterase/lipase family protein [Lachnospiraceae bacterium]|jgi:hypothetical protein|nr:GDSL-type esterase/lipase family protein [Lachnospiraceae bacterium]